MWMFVLRLTRTIGKIQLLAVILFIFLFSMGTNQPKSNQINEASFSFSTQESLLVTLEKGSPGNSLCRDHHGGPALGTRDERKCSQEEVKDDIKGKRSIIKVEKEKVVQVLKEMNEFHLQILTGWRKVMRECHCMFKNFPQGSIEDQGASYNDISGYKKASWSQFVDPLLSVGEEMEDLMVRVTEIISKLDSVVLLLSNHEKSADAGVFQESAVKNDSAQPKYIRNQKSNLDFKERFQDAHGQKNPLMYGDISSNFSKGKESEGRSQTKGQEGKSDSLLETEDKERERKIEQKNEEKWIRVWPKSQTDDPCFIRAPAGALKCEAADTLSCLMVSDSEELVSRVVRVKVQDKDAFRFPVTVALPFCVRHRSNHREVAVKVVDEKKRVSYITPVTRDEVDGGQKGCFAEVKVYYLGVFAVVLCVRREMYNVPKRGLSLKIPMDTRISLNYPSGSFTAPVMALIMVQPVDACLLLAVKSRSDSYKPVQSVSSVLHLTHPNSQPLRRPLTITLPCPPNPDKNETSRKNRKEHPDGDSYSLLPLDKGRIFGVHARSSERTELLNVVVSRDKQWTVLDEIVIRNQQNGLVSFDLREIFDRLLVVRLLSPLQSCHLTSLAEELEASACRHSVSVVLQYGRDDPHNVLMTALPSRDLSWEMNKLRARGYDGQRSSEISLCEGDQLLLHFSGNITATAFTQSNRSEDQHYRLTFHCQRRNQLSVHLTEVDPFGNHTSLCYKGMALFYRVTRAELEWRGDKAILRDAKHLENPLCKLPLSLPKKVRVIHHPIVTRVKISEEAGEPLSDALLSWLSGELSQEETGLLVSSLHLSRSAAQLVKLRSGDSASDQAFQALAMWRRALPAVTRHPRASQLARSLAKIGRPDLAQEVLLREEALSKARSLKK